MVQFVLIGRNFFLICTDRPRDSGVVNLSVNGSSKLLPRSPYDCGNLTFNYGTHRVLHMYLMEKELNAGLHFVSEAVLK